MCWLYLKRRKSPSVVVFFSFCFVVGLLFRLYVTALHNHVKSSDHFVSGVVKQAPSSGFGTNPDLHPPQVKYKSTKFLLLHFDSWFIDFIRVKSRPRCIFVR